MDFIRTGILMLHHLYKHVARPALGHAVKQVGRFYAANPHKAVAHAASAVQISSMAWTHGAKAAKHTSKFMLKAASRGFNLFRS